MSDRVRNLEAMAEHGIKRGDVRRRSAYCVVRVIGPAETFPRNGKGLVRCIRTWGNHEPEETHFWPETLAHYPVEPERNRVP